MQHYESASFQMLRHQYRRIYYLCQYDTPTFKTNPLRLDSNEGRLKRLLLQYKRLMQPYLSLVWLELVTHIVPHDTPTFKTKALRLASIEGWVKRLLLLY